MVLPYITAEYLFYGFVFAAIAFLAMLWYMYGLKLDMCGLRAELAGARKELAESNKGREKLNQSIDRLIMRRDDLLACLNAAKNDEEKVACIMRLMGEDK